MTYDDIIQKGLARHKQEADQIINDPSLSRDEKQDRLVDMWYEFLYSSSWTDQCFAHGYLDKVLENL